MLHKLDVSSDIGVGSLEVQNLNSEYTNSAYTKGCAEFTAGDKVTYKYSRYGRLIKPAQKLLSGLFVA